MERQKSTAEHKSTSVSTEKDANADEIAPVPPFQGSKEDRILTRKRQALFIRQTLRIAERFSRNPVTPAMLAAALPWLEREQFDNIAVERNTHGNCGYVLCPKPQGASIDQIYRISTHRRRVYDATARKPFCSDWCYRAFQHVRKQVSAEPGWCRFVSGTEEPPKVSLLPAHASGRPGKLVLDALNRWRLDEASCSPVGSDNEKSDSDSGSQSSSSVICSDSSDSSTSHHSKILDSDDYDDGESLLTDSYANYKRLVSRTKHLPVETSWGKEVKLPTRNLVVERTADQPKVLSPIVRTQFNPTKKVSVQSETCDPLYIVATRLCQWLSSRSLSILVSPNTANDVPSEPEELTSSEPSRKEEVEPKYDSSLDRDETPLPPGVLPLVDSVSVDTMRKHILMEALGPCIKSFLLRLGVPSQCILSKLDRAVVHFRLTNQNLHLNRTQRGIASLALLRIMAPSESSLHALLDESQLESLLTSVYSVPVNQFIHAVVHPFLEDM